MADVISIAIIVIAMIAFIAYMIFLFVAYKNQTFIFKKGVSPDKPANAFYPRGNQVVKPLTDEQKKEFNKKASTPVTA